MESTAAVKDFQKEIEEMNDDDARLKIIKDWQNKKDARFPKGENDSDVLKRIKKFKKLLITLKMKSLQKLL